MSTELMVELPKQNTLQVFVTDGGIDTYIEKVREEVKTLVPDITTKKGQTLFSISCSAINMGDVAYQNHLSRLKYAAQNMATGRTGVYNMGRNFSIKLNIPLSYKLGK